VTGLVCPVLVTGFVCLNFLIIIRGKSDVLDRSKSQVIIFCCYLGAVCD